MIGMQKWLRRLRSNESGATAVEFAVIAVPMFFMIGAGLDLAHQSYVRTVMQGALNDAARKAAVERPDLNGSGDSVEEQVEATIRQTVGAIAKNATINITQQSYFDFSSISNPEKLMTDVNGNGDYDEDDEDCFEDANGNGEFDTDAGTSGTGGASDVVLYRATITMPRLYSSIAASPLSESMAMELQTSVRNQPYGTQATAPVVCGEAP